MSAYAAPVHSGELVDTLGDHRITGVVDELGVVGSYPILLYLRPCGRLARRGWADGAGNYVFNNLAYRDQGYFVIALDHTAPYVNAAIADLVTPEPMP